MTHKQKLCMHPCMKSVCVCLLHASIHHLCFVCSVAQQKFRSSFGLLSTFLKLQSRINYF